MGFSSCLQFSDLFWFANPWFVPNYFIIWTYYSWILTFLVWFLRTLWKYLRNVASIHQVLFHNLSFHLYSVTWYAAYTPACYSFSQLRVVLFNVYNLFFHYHIIHHNPSFLFPLSNSGCPFTWCLTSFSFSVFFLYTFKLPYAQLWCPFPCHSTFPAELSHVSSVKLSYFL